MLFCMEVVYLGTECCMVGMVGLVGMECWVDWECLVVMDVSTDWPCFVPTTWDLGTVEDLCTDLT